MPSSWASRQYTLLLRPRSAVPHGANAPRACRAVAPRLAKTNRRVARYAFASPNPSETPPSFPARNLIPADSRRKIPAPRLGSAACRARACARRMANRLVRKRGIAMPHLTTDDGIRLYYEETGSGAPIVFVHEFAGDHRSWEPQVRCFARRYRCITYNARGYPPSDVPSDGERYSQERARDDIRAVLDALRLDKAHIVGLSMGGFATLHFGFAYPDRARSLAVCGCGYGAAPDERKKFMAEAE